MKIVSEKLLRACQDWSEQMETLDPFAPAMQMSPAEIVDAIGNAQPMAVKTAKGWTAALWLHHPQDDRCGQLLEVAQACRTRKLALIAANYYRLHHLINQAPDTSPSL